MSIGRFLMSKQQSPELLQAYLQELSRAAAETDIVVRKRELLRSYAELQYRISGGGRCALCNAHVRHALPVSRQAHNGEVTRFDCLCTRCFEGERVRSARVSVHAGEVTQHFDSEGKITYETEGDRKPK